MKDWWSKQCARVDALSLRERVFLLLSLMACVLAVADLVWLTPAQSQHKQLTQRFEKQNLQLQSLRAQLGATGQSDAAAQRLRADLAETRANTATINAEIQRLLAAGREQTAAPMPQVLPQVLAQFLKSHEGLTLVRTAALPVEPATTKGVAGVTRQGLELTVAGPYAELVRYVQTLEKALPTLRWGQMAVSSGNPGGTGPTQVTLQVYLLGIAP